MTHKIHPTAIVAPSADIADDVEIGPYAIIGENVTLGEGCSIGPHAVINGPTIMGKRNKVFQFASIGEAPQDLSYNGEPTRLEVGDDNIFREFTSVQRGTTKDKGITRIGNHNLLMNYAHVAHDCVLHDHIILANSAALAGHVEIFSHAVIGALCAIHQFSRIGSYVFLARVAQVPHDVPPYLLVTGPGCELHGLNLVGLRRNGFSSATVTQLRRAFKTLSREGHSIRKAIELIGEMPMDDPAMKAFHDFLCSSKRGLVH